MTCTVKGNKKLRSHNTSYCLVEVVTKAGLTGVILKNQIVRLQLNVVVKIDNIIKYNMLNIIFYLQFLQFIKFRIYVSRLYEPLKLCTFKHFRMTLLIFLIFVFNSIYKRIYKEQHKEQST